MATDPAPTDMTFHGSNPYEQEAAQRWGHTDAYKESQERVKKFTKDDWKRISKEGDVLMHQIAAVSDKDPASPEVQELIAQHYTNLRHFYEPTLEMYRGLGNLYVEDARFGEFFDKYKKGLAGFMREAIEVFCDAQR